MIQFDQSQIGYQIIINYQMKLWLIWSYELHVSAPLPCFVQPLLTIKSGSKAIAIFRDFSPDSELNFLSVSWKINELVLCVASWYSLCNGT